jgi:hypothetical protein
MISALHSRTITGTLFGFIYEAEHRGIYAELDIDYRIEDDKPVVIEAASIKSYMTERYGIVHERPKPCEWFIDDLDIVPGLLARVQLECEIKAGLA